VLLHPAGGLAILLVLLFFMFQAVFSWAQPVMDLIHGRVRLAERRHRTGAARRTA